MVRFDTVVGALKLTPLRLANVPPPMALHELKLEDNILDVCMNRTSTGIAVLCEDSINLYEYNVSSKPIQAPRHLQTYTLPVTDGLFCRQVSCGVGEDVLVLLSRSNDPEDVLCHCTAGSTRLFTVNSVQRISNIFLSSDHSMACLETDDARILHLDMNPSELDTRELQSTELTRLPTYAPWVEVTQKAGSVSDATRWMKY